MISAIRLWKCSGADVIPKGSLLKQKRPNGVIKVVKSADSGERDTCQNPEFASNLEKTFAPARCANVCSTAGKGCLSRFTLLLSLVRSTQMRVGEGNYNGASARNGKTAADSGEGRRW